MTKEFSAALAKELAAAVTVLVTQQIEGRLSPEDLLIIRRSPKLERDIEKGLRILQRHQEEIAGTHG